MIFVNDRGLDCISESSPEALKPVGSVAVQMVSGHQKNFSGSRGKWCSVKLLEAGKKFNTLCLWNGALTILDLKRSTMMRSADDAPWGKARVMFLDGGCVRITLGVYRMGPRKSTTE